NSLIEIASLGEPHAAPPVPQGRLRVLVVDDDQDSGCTLAVVLGMYGFRVDVAASGPEALAAAQARLPGAALMDLGLPGESGYAVAKRLRPLFQKTPLLIAVTGYGQASDRQRSKDEGFDHHLVKPVEPSDLVRLLQEYEDALLLKREGVPAPS